MDPYTGNWSNIQPFIAIILPNKIEGKKFKPIPVDYISGDNKEEICIINETLKIDSSGLTIQEIVNDFIRKFLSNWKSFKTNQPAKNYLYMHAPDVSIGEYEYLKKKYFELEENFQDK